MVKKRLKGTTVDKINIPEIVFGLVGPIGVNLDLVTDQIKSQLDAVKYQSHLVKITDLLCEPPFSIKIDDTSYSNRYLSLIKEADKICEKYGSADFLARLSMARIREIRRTITGSTDEPALGRAYIIRQLKREAEIEILKKVYGRKFVLVSVYLNERQRREYLTKKIAEYNSSTATDDENTKEAIALMAKDAQEENELHGQEVSLIFHKGDVFVDGANKAAIENTISRFIQAFFGHNGISPTRAEYGMYTAAGASLRSIDLSRQVGAAIFSETGEVVSLGCNEVPKAFGGTYWCDDGSDTHRDFEEGVDANQIQKTVIIRDLLERLEKLGFLNKVLFKKLSKPNEFREFLNSPEIKDSKAMDIIEFGRMIHAEMGAVTDAARRGSSVKNTVMYCTTFPCHVCAKHIVASGIKRVVFLEPYPKSYAKKLHSDSITFEHTESDKKVLFEPFLGISPRRYRDIFEKGKRKDGTGRADDWIAGSPAPRLDDKSAAYIEVEEAETLPRRFLLRKRSAKRASVT